eukprot:TRINITY_DN13770_c0_g1_i3.p1 TRINITY_DN13770_c0_g1~~TRINITY_DN13770_c0_g1_i3.p1  ORF type:complete len:630 (-),score=62.48 TRINITY_DN13770_c0_g1_i3:348-2237(-)
MLGIHHPVVPTCLGKSWPEQDADVGSTAGLPRGKPAGSGHVTSRHLAHPSKGTSTGTVVSRLVRLTLRFNDEAMERRFKQHLEPDIVYWSCITSAIVLLEAAFMAWQWSRGTSSEQPPAATMFLYIIGVFWLGACLSFSLVQLRWRSFKGVNWEVAFVLTAGVTMTVFCLASSWTQCTVLDHDGCQHEDGELRNDVTRTFLRLASLLIGSAMFGHLRFPFALLLSALFLLFAFLLETLPRESMTSNNSPLVLTSFSVYAVIASRRNEKRAREDWLNTQSLEDQLFEADRTLEGVVVEFERQVTSLKQDLADMEDEGVCQVPPMPTTNKRTPATQRPTENSNTCQSESEGSSAASSERPASPESHAPASPRSSSPSRRSRRSNSPRRPASRGAAVGAKADADLEIARFQGKWELVDGTAAASHRTLKIDCFRVILADGSKEKLEIERSGRVMLCYGHVSVIGDTLIRVGRSRKIFRWKRSNAGTAADVTQASPSSSSHGSIVIEEPRPTRNDEGSIVSDEDRSDDFDTCVHLFRGDWTLIEGDVGSRFRQLSFNGIQVTLADSSLESLTRSSSGEVLLKGARLFLEGDLLVRVRGNGSACKYRRGLPVTNDDAILVSDDEDSGRELRDSF